VTPTDPADVVRNWIERVWNGHDLDALDDLHPTPFLNEGAPSTPDDARAWLRDMWATFPDLKYAIDEVVSAGNRVAIRWTATGTQDGLLWGSIQPTGRRAMWRGIHLVKVEAGRITEVRAVSNMAAIGPQLGLEMRPAAEQPR
jgi:predicted ester cyclase